MSVPSSVQLRATISDCASCSTLACLKVSVILGIQAPQPTASLPLQDLRGHTKFEASDISVVDGRYYVVFDKYVAAVQAVCRLGSLL